MNKATKWILFGAAAGATAAGVYYLLKNKDKFCVEETNPDGTKTRTYVPLDMDAAKAKVTDAYNKTVEKAQEAWKKVEEKFASKDDDAEVTEEVTVEETVVADDAVVAEDMTGDVVSDTETVSEDISDFSDEEETNA